MYHLAVASITSKGAIVNILNSYRRPLGPEAILANMLFSLSKLSYIIRHTVMNVSNFNTNHSKSYANIPFIFSIASLS